MTSLPRSTALPGWRLAPFALVGGVTLSLAFAPTALWPLAPVAVALLGETTVRARGKRAGLALGALFGLGLLVPGIIWQLTLTAQAYGGLIAVELPFYALLGLGLHLTGGWRAAPVWAAGLWTLIEHLFSTWPFDGFPWLRLGYAAVDTPLAGLYPLVGAGGVTTVVALVGALLGRLTVLRTPRAAAWAVGATAVALASGVAVPAALGSPTTVGMITVGWVQGGIQAGGIYGIGAPRTTTRMHAAELDVLMARVDAGELPRPDFVVGPENTTDMDPSYDAQTAALVQGMVARADAPVLVGSPLVGEREGERRTGAVWWTDAGPGPTYLKRHLVPMGEWVPFRDFFQPLIPDLAYVGAQTVPGPAATPLPVRLPHGRPLALGVAICYDVAYGDAFRGPVADGAQVLVVGSNNAMFAGSAQLGQQWAITRVRAAEVRRPVLVVTTSGISGLIDADGRVAVGAPEGKPASGVERMALHEGVSPFVAGGWAVEDVLAWGTLLALAVAGAAGLGRMRKNGRGPANVAGRTEN